MVAAENMISGFADSDVVAETTAIEGKLIVLTAPLTEAIDHAGYFIQMAMASIPIWMEPVINRKYPKWREVEHYDDGSAKYMPAGVRLVEKSLSRVYSLQHPPLDECPGAISRSHDFQPGLWRIAPGRFRRVRRAHRDSVRAKDRRAVCR